MAFEAGVYNRKLDFVSHTRVCCRRIANGRCFIYQIILKERRELSVTSTRICKVPGVNIINCDCEILRAIRGVERSADP